MSGSPIIAVYAHPDDEVFSAGGTLARHAGDRHVVLVCATRGELGEISDPALATPETLGAVREGELLAAAAVLGIRDVRFLDFRDSGMAGTAGNDDPRAFMNQDRTPVIANLVSLFRGLKPAAVLTFDETGGYGHPDHIMIHSVVTEAFDLAGDPVAFPEAGPATEPGRLFYSVFSREIMRAMIDAALERGLDMGPMRDIDLDTFGAPKEAIDVVVDVTPQTARKLRAIQEHHTQMQPDSPFQQFTEELGQLFASREHFIQARGPRLPGSRPAPDIVTSDIS